MDSVHDHNIGLLLFHPQKCTNVNLKTHLLVETVKGMIYQDDPILIQSLIYPVFPSHQIY